MLARPLAAPVALLALGYDERSTQENSQHVENPRQCNCVLVTPGNSYAGATDDVSEQQEIRSCAEVASKIGI